jgi:DNA-binding winged helix-turn-helix (wHTH) protein
MTVKSFRFGEWQVNPALNSVENGELTRQLEPRAMDVLLYLCQRQGEVLSSQQLLQGCWGTSVLGDNPIHKAITQLRKAFSDSSSTPRYIETIHKRGYRTLAPVLRDYEGIAGEWLHASPFRGLQAFQEQHAAIFFGRKPAMTQLADGMREQAAKGCALLLVLGASGSGKTSLIRAGVIPQLDAACSLCLDLADMGDGDLFLALGSVLLDGEAGQRLLFEQDSATTLAARLRDDSASVAAQLRARLEGGRLALFVDSLEAIFRLPHEAEAQRAAFIATLEQLAQSGCVDIFLACRNDFYPHLSNYPPLKTLKQRGGHFDLDPPDIAEIAQIIRQPALAANLRFATDPDSGIGLDEVLCAEAQSRSDMLPLLQYCLEQLYQQRSPDGELSFTVFRALGGIEGAIGARAEQVTQSLDEPQVAALPGILAQLVCISEDALPVTSRRLPWSSLTHAPDQALVKAMVEARLFVSDLTAGVPTFGIAHDALLRRWPRAVAWIENHRHALQMRTRISLQAARWQSNGRSRDFLLPRGTQVNQARDLLHTAGFQLSAQDREYIDASLRLAQRDERRRAGFVTMVALLAILTGALGLMARASQKESEQHRVEAEELMGFMLGDFTDKLRPLGRLDLLDSVSSRALSYLAAAHPKDDGKALLQRAKALQVIAEIKVARADPAGASTALLAARQILNSRLEEQAAPDKPLLKSLGANAFWLGQIALDQRNWPDAERYFSEYLDFSNRLAAADPADIDGWIEQSYAHSNLGTVALKRGAIQHAADEFAASIGLKTRALARSPGRQDLQMDLANSLSWLASACVKLGQLDAATALYQREAELTLALHQAVPGNAQWTQRYAFALWHQATLQLERGETDAARSSFASAETLLQAVTRQDPSNRSWQTALYTVQLEQLKIGLAAPAARIAALQGLDAGLAELVKLEPKKWNLQRLSAVTAEQRARLYWSMQQPADAYRQLAASSAILEHLRQMAPADPLIRESMASTILLQAEFKRSEQDIVSARAACGKAAELLQLGAAAEADYRQLSQWARAARCAGDEATAARAQAQLNKMQHQQVRYTQALAVHFNQKETQ